MVMELMNGSLHGKTFDKDTATRIILDVLSGVTGQNWQPLGQPLVI
jgi:hypothetical protein